MVLPPATAMTAPMPFVAFGRATVPEGSVPMKFPAIVLPEDWMSMALLANRFTTNPRIVEEPPVMTRPSTVPAFVPSISIRRIALSGPGLFEFGDAPGCV